jgi:hypothetical protein
VSFGKALTDSSTKVKKFKENAERARGFKNLIGNTIRLREEMAKTADKSGDAFAKLLKPHDANIFPRVRGKERKPSKPCASLPGFLRRNPAYVLSLRL